MVLNMDRAPRRKARNRAFVVPLILIGMLVWHPPVRGQSRLSQRAAAFNKSASVTWTHSPRIPAADQPVTFLGTANGTSGRVFWLWDFGDGMTSTRQNETHAFRSSGFHRVSLTITDLSGSKKAIRTITVMAATAAASFTFSPASPIPGQPVSFKDTTPGNPTAWSWDFGDGSTSSLQNPSHAFATTGTYKVSLVATDATGSRSASRTIVIAAVTILNASFTFAPASPMPGQSVQFQDLSTGSPSSWLWNFGDGSSSTLRNPGHTYAKEGTFTVSLTIKRDLESKTVSKAVSVQTSLKAAFSFSPASPVVGQTVQFSDASTGNPSSWLWSFNDGASSTERNPAHAFSSQGAFNVVLSVSNGSRSESAVKAVVVGTGSNGKGPYWVSPIGTATWAGAQSETPLAGAACASLATANTFAMAGDTVYLRGGAYRQAVAPANSGRAEARIAFMAYPGETPVFTVTSDADGRWGISLVERDYIRIEGLTFDGCLAFFRILASNSNEISHCTFERSGGLLYSTALIANLSLGTDGSPGSTNNWIHDCIFTKYGEIYNGEEMGTVRLSSCYLDPSGHNTVENNVFSYGGHDCLDVGGEKNVIKNNVFHNEEAYFRDLWRNLTNAPTSGYFGNRDIHVSNSGNVGASYHTLIEGNRIGHAGTPPDDDGSCGIENAGAHTITRYNDIYGNGGMGYYSKMQGVYESNVRSGSWARVYNNTLYHNGFGDPSVDTQFKHGICIWSYRTYNDWPQDIVITNNIVYDNYNEWRVGSPNILPQVTYANNFNLNPYFQNADLSDKTSLVLPNLTLQLGSPCIDTGAPLTQANGGGASSTTLVVDDALFFQDGSWGSGLTHGLTLVPDWIAIGTVTNIVKIASVDYATKTITLASPMTWPDDAKIWLYSDSSGRRVLRGSAPDIGAHEIGQ